MGVLFQILAKADKVVHNTSLSVFGVYWLSISSRVASCSEEQVKASGIL
jgi:hypothetical protein